MRRITANLDTGVKRAKLQGKDYLVAPLTLIVPGVLAGSKGALFYPSSEVEKSADAWNGMPIVINHPADTDGTALSARDPDVLNKQGIGMVLHSEIDGSKLKGEGWFDIEATRRIRPDLYDRLISGKPIELSTGLFTENEEESGSHKGRAYDYVARNYRPDHLAILPDQVGACSVEDGCGVHVNNEVDIVSQALAVLNGWITVSGAHIFVGEGGEVEKGPKGLKDKFGKGKGDKKNSHGVDDKEVMEKYRNDKKAKREGFKDHADKQKFEETDKKYAKGDKGSKAMSKEEEIASIDKARADKAEAWKKHLSDTRERLSKNELHPIGVHVNNEASPVDRAITILNEFSPEARAAALEARKRNSKAKPDADAIRQRITARAQGRKAARQGRLAFKGKRVASRPEPAKPSAPTDKTEAKGGKYGMRHNPEDGAKGEGFLGPQKAKNGDTMTEVSIGFEIDGKERDVPALVPGLTKSEVKYITDGGDPNKNESIRKKALDHAQKRIKEGKSPFADKEEEGKSSPTDNAIDLALAILNANPEGCNQYKACGTGGGGLESFLDDSDHLSDEELTSKYEGSKSPDNVPSDAGKPLSAGLESAVRKASGKDRNFALISDLRKEYPHLSKEEFHKQLKELRVAQKVTLDAYQGETRKLTTEQLDDAVHEGGQKLVHISVRNQALEATDNTANDVVTLALVVLNDNPRGCNQYTGPGCAGPGKPGKGMKRKMAAAKKEREAKKAGKGDGKAKAAKAAPKGKAKADDDASWPFLKRDKTPEPAAKEPIFDDDPAPKSPIMDDDDTYHEMTDFESDAPPAAAPAPPQHPTSYGVEISPRGPKEEQDTRTEQDLERQLKEVSQRAAEHRERTRVPLVQRMKNWLRGVFKNSEVGQANNRRNDMYLANLIRELTGNSNPEGCNQFKACLGHVKSEMSKVKGVNPQDYGDDVDGVEPGTLMVRDFGKWVRGEGRRQGDEDFDEDDDHMELSEESSKAMSKIIEGAHKKFPGIKLEWGAEEKNWLSVRASKLDPLKKQTRNKAGDDNLQNLIKESAMRKLTENERKAMVDKLVGNCKCETKDKAALNSLSDVVLASMLVNAFPPKKEVEEEEVVEEETMEEGAVEEEEEVVNDGMAEGSCAGAKGGGDVRVGGGDKGYTHNSKQVTEQEWLSKAPPHIAALVRNGLRQEAAKKSKMIKTIMGHINNQFSEKALNGMTVELLTPIFNLAKPTANRFTEEADYSGAGLGGFVPTVNDGGGEASEEDMLVAPVLNFERKQA